MSEIKILSLFEKTLVEFFDELIDQFPYEGDLVMIRIFLQTQVPIVKVMNVFNTRLNANDCELKKMITDRNEKFFLENNIFDSFGKDKVGHFKNVWLSSNITDDIKESIWTWVDGFVKLGDAYMKVMSVKSK